jgi:hypothetical protein
LKPLDPPFFAISSFARSYKGSSAGETDLALEFATIAAHRKDHWGVFARASHHRNVYSRQRPEIPYRILNSNYSLMGLRVCLVSAGHQFINKACATFGLRTQALECNPITPGTTEPQLCPRQAF